MDITLSEENKENLDITKICFEHNTRASKMLGIWIIDDILKELINNITIPSDLSNTYLCNMNYMELRQERYERIIKNMIGV